jgi:hypothetical protein
MGRRECRGLGRLGHRGDAEVPPHARVEQRPSRLDVADDDGGAVVLACPLERRAEPVEVVRLVGGTAEAAREPGMVDGEDGAGQAIAAGAPAELVAE